MTYAEIFLDNMGRNRLSEMTIERKKAEDKIEALMLRIFEHIMKIMLFSNEQPKNHWISEVNSWLNLFQKFKLRHTKKRIDIKTLRLWMITQPEYQVNEFMNDIIKKHPDFEPNNISNFQRKIDKILEAVVVDISKNKFTSIKDYI